MSQLEPLAADMSDSGCGELHEFLFLWGINIETLLGACPFVAEIGRESGGGGSNC